MRDARHGAIGGHLGRVLIGLVGGLLVAAALAAAVPASAGTVFATYTDLPLATATNLTATGTLDWVKYGVNGGGTGWTFVGKTGVTPLISRGLTSVGTPPPGTSVVLIGIAPPANVLSFSWTDGTGPGTGTSNTIVTETILPAQFDYPLGLGATLTVPAAASTRVLDAYVQGFNADMQLTATMSGGGSASIVVPPTKNPPGDTPNNYSSGRFTVTFAGAGEVLTVTARTVSPTKPGDRGFANAGFFAAALNPATHPLDLALNGTTYRGGDTMVLTVTLNPDGVAGLVDAYVMVRLPDNSLISLQLDGSIVGGAVPLAQAFAPFAVSGELLRVQIPAGLPGGTFTWIGELTQYGTQNVIGTPSQVPFTLVP